MSVHKMIAVHPDVQDLDEELAIPVRHAMFCSVMCISCADACSVEQMDMRQCLRSCLDCADICEATSRLAVRRTSENVAVLRSMTETCIRACQLCGEECARHEHERYRLCADMCQECAEDRRDALPTIQ